MISLGKLFLLQQRAFVVQFAASLALLANAQTLLPASLCQTPPVQCCQYAGKPATNPIILDIVDTSGILGIDPNVIVGVLCSPITAAGPACTTNALCCKRNNFPNDIIAYDCQYVDLTQ